MKNLILGYAEALYEIASEYGCEKIFFENLSYICQIMQNNPKYIKILSSPDINKENKTKMLNQAFKERININILNFLKILVRNKKINTLFNCYNEYKKIYNKRNNIVDITLITAIEMSENQIQKVIINLGKRLNKKIHLINKIDKKCIGGIKVLYDSNLIDLSVKNSLNMIRYSL